MAGLLLVDPPLDASVLSHEVVEQTLQAMRGPDYQQVVEDYYRSIAEAKREVVDRIVAEARTTPQATAVGTFEALRDFNPREFAGRYSGPTLSIIQPQYDVEGALHQIPPGWRCTTIPATGHWIHLDAMQTFLEITQFFLASQSLWSTSEESV